MPGRRKLGISRGESRLPSENGLLTVPGTQQGRQLQKQNGGILKFNCTLRQLLEIIIIGKVVPPKIPGNFQRIQSLQISNGHPILSLTKNLYRSYLSS